MHHRLFSKGTFFLKKKGENRARFLCKYALAEKKRKKLKTNYRKSIPILFVEFVELGRGEGDTYISLHPSIFFFEEKEVRSSGAKKSVFPLLSPHFFRIFFPFFVGRAKSVGGKGRGVMSGSGNGQKWNEKGKKRIDSEKKVEEGKKEGTHHDLSVNRRRKKVENGSWKGKEIDALSLRVSPPPADKWIM